MPGSAEWSRFSLVEVGVGRERERTACRKRERESPASKPPALSLSFYMPSALFLYTLLSLWFPLILSLYDSGWIQPLIRPGPRSFHGYLSRETAVSSSCFVIFFSFTVLKDFVGFVETVSGFGNRGNHAANPYFCNLTILSGFEQFQPVSQVLRLRIRAFFTVPYQLNCILYYVWICSFLLTHYFIWWEI